MYSDSHALSSDSRPILPLPRENLSVFPKQRELPEFLFMGYNPNSTDYRQNSSGLLRFRSAPSSFLQNLVEKNESFLNSRFCPDEGDGVHGLGNDEISNNDNNKGVISRLTAVNSQLPPQYPRQNSEQFRVEGGGYGVPGSTIGMGQQGQGKMGSGLMRQNSSFAGLFSHLASQNGYAARGDFGNYRISDDTTNGGLSPSTGVLKNNMSYSSRMSSSLGILSRITEVENENGRSTNGLDEEKVGNSCGVDGLFYSSGFPFGSWNDSSSFAEPHFIKREVDNDQNLYFNAQNGEAGNRPHVLQRRSSLPKTSSGLGAMDKMLQLQDTVPWKIRAKRGCATHPRSIAERLRRTRISERMRKLQELVPNMEKQTNTADMLDFAVDYIKTLQEQYKKLIENEANCKCSAFQRQF